MRYVFRKLGLTLWANRTIGQDVELEASGQGLFCNDLKKKKLLREICARGTY